MYCTRVRGYEDTTPPFSCHFSHHGHNRGESVTYLDQALNSLVSLFPILTSREFNEEGQVLEHPILVYFESRVHRRFREEGLIVAKARGQETGTSGRVE